MQDDNYIGVDVDSPDWNVDPKPAIINIKPIIINTKRGYWLGILIGASLAWLFDLWLYFRFLR